MKIHVDSMEYLFQYTDFALSKDFKEQRKQYVTKFGTQSPILFDMPTPHKVTRTIGQWTLSDPLSKGSSGRVFLGSNSKNEMVAIKIMMHTSRTAGAIDGEIAQCRELTALAQKWDDGGRLVRLKEVIDPRKASPSSSIFEDVALVLEPMTPQTLSDLIKSGGEG